MVGCAGVSRLYSCVSPTTPMIVSKRKSPSMLPNSNVCPRGVLVGPPYARQRFADQRYMRSAFRVAFVEHPAANQRNAQRPEIAVTGRTVICLASARSVLEELFEIFHVLRDVGWVQFDKTFRPKARHPAVNR